MKIAIIGYGLEGRALAVYLRKHSHDITVCDLRQPEGTEEHVGIRWRFGPHYLKNLREFEAVFRSPGIPFLKKEFDAARDKLTSLTKYFFEKCPCQIVGVTGTKGKGTTAMLIYEMLKKTHEKTGSTKRVFIGGNIGHTPLEFLDGLKPTDTVILELSSFQLQDLDRSPHLAVVLGITPDHMDHHGNMEEYVDAKKNIVSFQKPGDFAVLDADNKYSVSFAAHTKAGVYEVSTEKTVRRGGFVKMGKFVFQQDKMGIILGEGGKTKLIGQHNIKNILAAATAAHLLGAPVEVITEVVREFPGLPHRLEFVGETNGARFYNDSASTNPQTAIAAVQSFDGPTILIAGGSDKNADYAPLGREIAKRMNIKAVIVMGQTKPQIEAAIEHAIAVHPQKREMPLELISADSYQEAFMVAKAIAGPGDTVLLSPASASFDMFSNYQERGDIFRNFIADSAGA